MLGKETVYTRLGNPIAYHSTLTRILGRDTIQDTPIEHPSLTNGEVSRVR